MRRRRKRQDQKRKQSLFKWLQRPWTRLSRWTCTSCNGVFKDIWRSIKVNDTTHFGYYRNVDNSLTLISIDKYDTALKRLHLTIKSRCTIKYAHTHILIHTHTHTHICTQIERPKDAPRWPKMIRRKKYRKNGYCECQMRRQCLENVTRRDCCACCFRSSFRFGSEWRKQVRQRDVWQRNHHQVW